jgi:hypothetical protein
MCASNGIILSIHVFRNFRYLWKVISGHQFTAYIFVISMVIYVIASNKRYHALSRVLKKKSIMSSLRVGLYKKIIRPVVTYGAEL